ncbi:MAG: hypothetical protein PUI75_07360 [Subdoligranulum sp.]|nr:hypothetical protein [Subdoligranulum sp.]MDY6124905.1 hypothetical protein [Gemmiger qucibialis]
MDRADVMQLITVTYTDDDINQKIPAETARNVFCNVASVSASEWFEAGRAGMQAALKVTMFAPDYQGEQIAVVGGIRYGVYRTYLTKNETLELYLERKAGI